jgi:hypothetical protein
MRLAHPEARTWSVAALLLFGAATCSDGPATPVIGDRTAAYTVAPQRPIAFVDVTIIPMNASGALAHQTVIARDGRIVAVGPATATVVPSDAILIKPVGDAFLIPGLADMHVHTLVNDELVLNIANGVTTVRNLHGVPGHLAWRDSIAHGLKFGPRIYTSGPIVDGSPPARSTNVVVRTTADVDALVAAQHDSGYDFLKVYDNLSMSLYQDLAAAAARNGLRMVGHIPIAVGLDGLLAVHGQFGIEHAEMFLPTRADPAHRQTQIARLAAQRVWLDPTLDVFDNYAKQMTGWATMMNRPEMRYVSPTTAKTWGWFDASNPNHNGSAGRLDYITACRAFFLDTLMRELSTAGVRFVAGTDAPLPMIVPGYALHDELELLVRAGLSPYEALATATRNAAEMMGPPANFGLIAVGRDADLVLLDADPLTNIANTRRITGVLAQGRWYSADDLHARLETLAKAYGR